MNHTTVGTDGFWIGPIHFSLDCSNTNTYGRHNIAYFVLKMSLNPNKAGALNLMYYETGSSNDIVLVFVASMSCRAECGTKQEFGRC